MFGKFVTKMEPSGITPFFYNNFFDFGGGGFPPFPLPTPMTISTDVTDLGSGMDAA